MKAQDHDKMRSQGSLRGEERKLQKFPLLPLFSYSHLTSDQILHEALYLRDDSLYTDL